MLFLQKQTNNKKCLAICVTQCLRIEGEASYWLQWDGLVAILKALCAWGKGRYLN